MSDDEQLRAARRASEMAEDAARTFGSALELARHLQAGIDRRFGVGLDPRLEGSPDRRLGGDLAQMHVQADSSMQELMRQAQEHQLQIEMDRAASVQDFVGRLEGELGRPETIIRSAQEFVRQAERDCALGSGTGLKDLIDGDHVHYRLADPRELARIADLASQNTRRLLWGDYPWTLVEAMEAIREPWIDAQNVDRSIAAFAELHALGRDINNLAPFEEPLSAILRENLGDWRTLHRLPEGLIDDPRRRVDFYRSLGFNQALTDFPRPAFDHILRLNGLRASIISPSAPPHDAGEEAEPGGNHREDEARNARAYTVLLRFETQLRAFIASKMAAAFGRRWIKERVPGAIWQDWQRKRKEALAAGRQGAELIAYADIGDYPQIIVRKDNWNDVFKTVFRQQDEVIVSLRRVRLIRLCTMHSRPIEPEDELTLQAEVQRLSKAIG